MLSWISLCDKASREAAGQRSIRSADVTQRGWQSKSESLIQQLTSTMYCHPYLSKQSCLPSTLIPHARIASALETSVTPVAVGCWRTVTTVSACLLFSLRVMFQSRHDRSSATRFNPSGSGSRGTKHQPSHIIILMTASCREQYHTALMIQHSWSVGHVHIPSDCICTIGHYMGQGSTIVYMMASPVCLALVCSSLALCVSCLETGPLSVWVFVKAAQALSVSRLGA